jgi:hypothetical protein
VARPVPAGAHGLRPLDQLLVGRLEPEAAGLVDVDAIDAYGVTTSPRTNADSSAVAFLLGFVSQTGTTSEASTSMNELTEKTAFPTPGLP